VKAGISRATVISSALVVNFLSRTVADVGKSTFREILRKIIQPLEMVAGISYLIRLKSKPLNNFPNGNKIAFLLSFRVGIIVTKITFTAVVSCKPEINSNGLAVPDVKVSIGLETERLTSCSSCYSR